jgi:hypothetical protein
MVEMYSFRLSSLVINIGIPYFLTILFQSADCPLVLEGTRIPEIIRRVDSPLIENTVHRVFEELGYHSSRTFQGDSLICPCCLFLCHCRCILVIDG